MSPATTRTRTVKRTTGLNWRSVSSKAARYFLPSIRTWDSTPASCVIAFYRDLRDRLWGVYGFVDFQPAAELGTGYLHGTESSAHGSDDREQSHRRSVEGVYVKSGDSYNDREPWARPIISPVSYTPRGSSAVNPPPLVEGVDYYLENGLLVFTAHYLRSRGYCCQSGCRHCPYGFMKDPSTLEQCPE